MSLIVSLQRNPTLNYTPMDEFTSFADLRLAAVDGGDDPGPFPIDEDHQQYGALTGMCVVA